jgi:long-chain fatty acid transport protein
MHLKHLNTVRVVLGSIVALNLTTNLWAGGAFIGNEVPSARSSGEGYVGVAGQNDDPTVVYSNPGAITKLKGTQVTIGGHFENVRPEYESHSGAKTSANSTNVVIPNISMTQTFMDGNLGAGLSVQSPFGLETHWPGDSPQRYVATDSKLAILQIMPAISYQVIPMLSIGAGVNFAKTIDAQLDRHINVDALNAALGGAPAGAADAVSSLRGEGSGWGWFTGLLLELSEKHAIGVTYHSKVDMRINGNETVRNLAGVSAGLFGGNDYTTSAYTDIVLPSYVEMGYAFKPTDKWKLELDATWMHWAQLKDLNVRFAVESDPIRQAVLQTGNPMVFNPRDAWSLALGTNYKLTDRWQVRTGTWYEPWAVPESNFTPSVVDLTRTGLSFGGGYKLTESLIVDASYTAIITKSRSVTNNVGSTTSGIPAGGVPLAGIPDPDISGNYSDWANIIGLNLTYKFGNK